MAHITATRSLQLAAASWPRGVRMDTIIVDCWSRGCLLEQTIHECIQAGYAMCVCVPAIKTKWAHMDADIAAYFNRPNLYVRGADFDDF